MSKKNFGYTSISNIRRRLGTWDSRKPGQSPKEMKALLEGADKTLKETKMKPESQGPTESGKLQDKKLKIHGEPRVKISTNYVYDLGKLPHNRDFKQELSSSWKKSIGSLISSNKPESAKVRNPLTIHDRSTGGPRKGHGDYLRFKHYKSRTYSPDTPTRTGVYGSEVTRNPSLRKSATDAVKDKVNISPVGDLTSKHFSPKHRADMNQLKKDIKEIRDFANKPVRDYRQEFRQSIKPNVTYRTQGKQDLLEGKPRKTTVSARAGAGLQHIKAQFKRYGAKQWLKSKTH